MLWVFVASDIDPQCFTATDPYMCNTRLQSVSLTTGCGLQGGRSPAEQLQNDESCTKCSSWESTGGDILGALLAGNYLFSEVNICIECSENFQLQYSIDSYSRKIKCAPSSGETTAFQLPLFLLLFIKV